MNTTNTNELTLILGGSSGIGLATAQRLVQRGRHVLLVARNPDKLARAKAELGERASTAQVDLRDPVAVQAFVKSLDDLEHPSPSSSTRRARLARHPSSSTAKPTTTPTWI